MISTLTTIKTRVMATLVLGFGVWLAAAGPVSSSSLAADLSRVEAVREIKNLQRVYAQLTQYGLWAEMAALFDDTGVLSWGSGQSQDGSDTLSNATGPKDIEDWLRADAGHLTAVNTSPVQVLVNDMPVVSLSENGQTAKGRWAVMRWFRDDPASTEVERGIFENDYVQSSTGWKISLLRYHPLYVDNHIEASTTSIPSYHFTPDEAGAPIVPESEAPLPDDVDPCITIEGLAYRVNQLNEEDAVRNLVHAMGYYVDRRMWTDVVSLFTPNGTAMVDDLSSAPGAAGIRRWLESTMGGEGLTRGVLNDRPIFNTIIQLSPDILTATARGIEAPLTINTTTPTRQHHLLALHHTLKRDTSTGKWKIHHLNYTRLSPNPLPTNATSTQPQSTNLPLIIPPLLTQPTPHHTPPKGWRPLHRTTTSNSTNDGYNPETVHRLLSRSAAYDETENVSGAYGLYSMGGGTGIISTDTEPGTSEGGDQRRCTRIAGLFARDGIGMVPGVGWVRGLERVEEGCENEIASGRVGIGAGFLWRVQPIILASQDGRAATVRVRMMDWAGLGGGVYHDQVVLEDGVEGGDGGARRKLWCVSLDEYYWGGGDLSSAEGNATAGLVPDVSLLDPLLGERQVGFMGGPGTPVVWPDIQRMWWEYRNPVKGTVPGSYWAPGCVPCRGARPEWALSENGYQEPMTGPTSVRASIEGSTVSVSVKGGPEEFVWGIVELHAPGLNTSILAIAILDGDGNTKLAVPPKAMMEESGDHSLLVYYLGNDRLDPGRTTININGAEPGDLEPVRGIW